MTSASRELRENFVHVRLDDCAAWELTGADAASWLQGQITQDVNTEGPFSACICKPTGQIEATLRGIREGAGFKLIMSEASAKVLANRVDQFVILEDVSLRQFADTIWTVQGKTAPSQQDSLAGIATWICPHDRTGYGGYDCILKDGATLTQTAHPHDLDIALAEHGLPQPDRDRNEKTLPPELGKTFDSQFVSYTKGCYTGQEVLMRIFSRGHTNRTFQVLATEAPASVGTAVLDEAGKGVGDVLRVLESPSIGPLATVLLRNEVCDPGSRLWIEGKRARLISCVVPTL